MALWEKDRTRSGLGAWLLVGATAAACACGAPTKLPKPALTLPAPAPRIASHQPSEEDLLADRLGLSVESATLLARTYGMPLDGLKGIDKTDLKSLLWGLRHPEHVPRARTRSVVSMTNARLAAISSFQKQLGRMTTLEKLTGTHPSRSPPAGASPFLLLAPPAAPLDGWEWLGPSNIGGRTRAIYAEKGPSGRVWIASPAGGLWLSKNSGQTWTPASDTLLNLAVTSIATDPDDEDTLYVGTGEGFYNEDAVRGAGLFTGKASKEGNQTWSQVTSTNTDDFAFVTRLATVKSPPALLVATDRGLFRLAKPAMTPTHVTSSEPIELALDVECDGARPAHCVAGDLRGQAFFSADGGVTWRRSNLVPTVTDCRVELAIASADSRYVYASVDTGSGMVFRSDNYGETYVAMNTRQYNYLGDHGWYNDTVWAGDPNDWKLVVVGGTALYRSKDGGAHFDPISSSEEPTGIHPDFHVIATAPAYGKPDPSVYVGSDGGVFWIRDLTQVSQDGGWDARNKGYGATQFYSAARSGGTLLGGTQDNGTLRQDDADLKTWREVVDGDGGAVAIDSNDPSYVYAEANNLTLERSTDGGKTFEPIQGEYWDGSKWGWWPDGDLRVLPDSKNSTAALIAPFVLDPTNSNRLLAGGQSLWQTTTLREASGPTWREILPPRFVGQSPTQSPSLIRAIATAPNGKVWVGYEDGAVVSLEHVGSDPFYTVAPATVSVPPIDADGYTRGCTGVVVDQANPERVFVAFGGYSASAVDNLWCTADGGKKWTNASQGLPGGAVHAVLVAPDRKTVYLGAEQGLFASVGDPKVCPTLWHRASTGATNCSVRDLRWDTDRVIVATHGRGVFSWKP